MANPATQLLDSVSNIGKDFYNTVNPAKPDTRKIQCQSKGGTWDEVNQVCIMPKPVAPTNFVGGTNQNKPLEPKLTIPEIIKDAEGRNTGISLPNRKTYLGIPQADIQVQANKFNMANTYPAGTNPAGTAQNKARRQQRIQELTQLSQQGLISPQELQAIQQTPIDWGQAFTAGVANVVPEAAGGAAIGAASGALAGGLGAVPGAVIGGAAGLITGLFTGVRSNIKQQQSGNIAATKDVLAAARTNMRALTMMASKDPTKAEEAIQQYYQQLNQVYRAQRKLQVETSGNLNKFMDDGTQDLSDFQLFLQPGGYADLQLMRLQTAIASGQPASDAELLSLSQEYAAE